MRTCLYGLFAVPLQTVGIGQEFVLDCDDYPEAVDWVVDLLRGCA